MAAKADLATRVEDLETIVVELRGENAQLRRFVTFAFGALEAYAPGEYLDGLEDFAAPLDKRDESATAVWDANKMRPLLQGVRKASDLLRAARRG